MVSPTIIIIAIVLFASIVVAFFYMIHQIRNESSLHQITLSNLQKDIRLNKQQIQNRQKGLEKYDFRLYNISEALVVQPEIQF